MNEKRVLRKPFTSSARGNPHPLEFGDRSSLLFAEQDGAVRFGEAEVVGYALLGGEALDDADAELARGDVGRVFFTTPSVGGFSYHKDPDKTASAYRGDNFDMAAAHPHLDFVNLMSYDFHGAWNRETGHHTNLCTSPLDPSSETWRLSVDKSVKLYRDTA